MRFLRKRFSPAKRPIKRVTLLALKNAFSI
jgi:hypothetical protein